MFGSMQINRIISKVFSLIVISSLITGCSFNLPGIISQPTSTPAYEGNGSMPTPLPQAEVTFIARVPKDTPAGQAISLDLLDEVTGLALNATRNLMIPIENGVYSVKIVAPLGSVLKYRYSRIGSPPSIEYTSTGKQVRYRLFTITGPTIVEDQVSAWTDLRYSGPVGRIQGNLIDSSTSKPIPSLLVEAGGIHTITTSDGSFLLEGLPPGKHTLFVYSLDGKFQPFQQEAVVGENTTTPASISVKPASMIKVTFVVRIPESALNPLPVRLIGNIYSLGNTFADLNGGLSTVANRAPLLTSLPDGSYTITLNLPAGMHLQYKYSLGDGFWNAEHSSEGKFRLREIVLPSNDTTLYDVIDTWKAPNSEAVSFSVTVPGTTPSGDYVSIQFNPFGWTEPIPMWPLGNNQWIYTLYSPLHLLGNIGYRYCRNDACGAADDFSTIGLSATGWPFTSSLITQDFQDSVERWAWWQPSGQPTTVVATEVQAKGSGFVTGIELQPNFQPAWLATLGTGFQGMKDLGSNWAFITPTFRYIDSNPPILESVPGRDMLWQDISTAVYMGQSRGLIVGLHAETVIETDPNEWWLSTSRDANWWANWFARYRTFVIHFADLASITNAGALVLGDSNTIPAYPDGFLPDGSPSNVPGNADQLWRELIIEVRQHYSGLLIWYLPSPAGLRNVPGFLEQVDAITFLLEDDLSDTNNPSQAELNTAIGSILDNSIKPVQDTFRKPVVIQVNYPSADGSAQGCINISGTCRPFMELNQPIQFDSSSVLLDLQEQVDLYNATMQAVNSRSWINGVISGGFFSPAVLQDKSSSIHGKPASDVVWYWYHEFLK